MSEKKEPLKIIAGTPDRPLIIGDIEIPCYVLEDETRVLSQAGFLQAIGRARAVGVAPGNDDKIPAFLGANNLKPFISKDLLMQSVPVEFQGRGGVNYGYRAILLPQVCEVYLAAHDAGALHESQKHILSRAYLLMRGLAEVGIIGLVDEATGYQDIRAKRALATILEKFIADELQPWTKTFPYEFYERLYELRGWSGPDGHKRTHQVAHDTNDLVYERLAPGVLDELREKNPRLPHGSRKDRFHQWFTPDFGHPKLKLHLAGVMALMRAAPNWTSFRRNLQRAYPRLEETIPLAIDED